LVKLIGDVSDSITAWLHFKNFIIVMYGQPVPFSLNQKTLSMSETKQMKRYIRDAIFSIKEKIDLDPLHNESITELANDAGIGRNVLQKGFRLLYNCSIKEYRLQKRMEKAKYLLEEGRLTRKQIALRCGYKTPNNFSTAFKKIYNISPNKFLCA